MGVGVEGWKGPPQLSGLLWAQAALLVGPGNKIWHRVVERTTPPPPPLIHRVALGKKRDYVGGGHLSKSPFHGGNGGDLSGQKTVTKGRRLCKFCVYRR